MPDRWPFADPRSLAVLSLDRIFREKRPVLYVLHDFDGGWQLLDGDDLSIKDATVVGLEAMVEYDPTLVEVAALPHGFFAFRESVDSAWQVGFLGDNEGEEDEDMDEDD